MFSAARRLRISGTAAPFINYVVCLAVLQGIRATAKGLLPVSSFQGWEGRCIPHWQGSVMRQQHEQCHRSRKQQ
jgi:hypothetical protein